MNHTTEHWINVSDQSLNTSVQNDSTVTDNQFSTFPEPGHYHFVTLMIWKIIPPIIISLGTMGNCLTVLVILRQKNRITSTSLFLLFLALSDILLLYTSPLRLWIRHYWNIDVRNLSEMSCKIHSYLTYVSVHLSSWLLVAVTVERVLSVMIPHRVKSGVTTTTAGVTISVIAVSVITLNSHFLYGMGQTFVAKANQYEQCYPKYESYQYFFNSILPWIDLCIAFVIPFIILTSGNVLIVIKLAVKRRRRRYMSNSNINQKHLINRDISLTVLLICLCIFFFVCLGPVSVYFIGFPYWRDGIIARMDQLDAFHDMEYLLFWHAVVNTIGYLNATCNFFFYVLSGTKFRREILNLIFCRNSVAQSVF